MFIKKYFLFPFILEYLLRQLDNITTTTDQFRNAYVKYSSNPEGIY